MSCTRHQEATLPDMAVHHPDSLLDMDQRQDSHQAEDIKAPHRDSLPGMALPPDNHRDMEALPQANLLAAIKDQSQGSPQADTADKSNVTNFPLPMQALPSLNRV